MAFGGYREKLVWCGPEDPQEIQKEFERLFYRKTVATGDVYLVAPHDAVAKVYATLMNKRHNFFDGDSEMSLYGRGMLRSMLTGAQFARLQGYEDRHARVSGMVPENLICDVEQNVGSPGDTSGSMYPSQLKHNLFYSFGKRRLCTGLENMVANGWHIFEEPPDKFSSELAPFLKGLKEQYLKSLSGNGMSLPPLCAWFLFVAMHTARRESPLASWGLGTASEEDDGEEEEDEQRASEAKHTEE